MFGEEESLKERILNNLSQKKQVVFCLILILSFYFLFLSSPGGFPKGYVYNLKYGETLSSVSGELKSQKIIRSEFLLKSFTYVFSFGRGKIIGGSYAFPGRQNVVTIAWRISHGYFEIESLRITIPEGMSSFEIADIFSKKMPFFNKEKFLGLVKSGNYEGYLFPDTYFLMPDTKEESIIKMMNDNFNEKIKMVDKEIRSFGKPIFDVIKMASIIEEEVGSSTEARKIVSGILWKRISIGMALQVDSSFKYINGKTTEDLSLEDLKIDSPYNSYTHTGLPPTPISNPGLSAIVAALEPEKTPYLYFLTDDEGNMHYGKTHDEHVANKEKYLK
jgi:UPF0755 protein